jgi:hypothetical protein
LNLRFQSTDFAFSALLHGKQIPASVNFIPGRVLGITHFLQKTTLITPPIV